MKLLRRAKGKKYNLAGLLRDCRERKTDDSVITLLFSHRSHMERMEEEIDDPGSRHLIADAVQKVLGKEYEIKVALIGGQSNGPRQSAAQKSHLVRAARMMGARVVSEKEESPDDE